MENIRKIEIIKLMIVTVIALGVVVFEAAQVKAAEKYPVPRPGCTWCKDLRKVNEGLRLTHPAFNYDNSYGQTHRNPFNSDYTRILMCENYYDKERYVDTLGLTLPPQRFPDDQYGRSKRHTARGPITALISTLQNLSEAHDYEGINTNISQTQESINGYVNATFNILGELGNKLSAYDTGSACKAVYFSPYSDEPNILYYLNRQDRKVHKLDISDYNNPIDTALNMSYHDTRNQNCVDSSCKALILGFTDKRTDPTGHPRIMITTDFSEQGPGEPQPGDPGFIGNLKNQTIETHQGTGLCDSKMGYWPNHNIHGDWSPDGKYFMKISGDGNDGVRRGPNHPSGYCDGNWYQPCTGGIQSSSRKPLSDNCDNSSPYNNYCRNNIDPNATGCGTADWYDNQNQGTSSVWRDYLTHPDWRFSNEWYVAGNGAFSSDAPNGDNKNPFVYDNWKVVQVFYNRKDVWDGDYNDFTGCDTNSCYYHNVLLQLSSAGNWANQGARGSVGENYHGMPSPTLSEDGNWLYTLHTNGKYSLLDYWCAIKKPTTRCSDSDYIIPQAIATKVINNYESMGIYLYDISMQSNNSADVNRDGKVNIKDIQAVIKEITGSSWTCYQEPCSADVNGDGHVNIKDIQFIIRAIIK